MDRWLQALSQFSSLKQLSEAFGILVPFQWKFCTSNGPGGQNVNKRQTAAQMLVNVTDMPIWVHQSLKQHHHVNTKVIGQSNETILKIQSQKHRSQEENKLECQRILTNLFRQLATRQWKSINAGPSQEQMQHVCRLKQTYNQKLRQSSTHHKLKKQGRKFEY